MILRLIRALIEGFARTLLMAVTTGILVEKGILITYTLTSYVIVTSLFLWVVSGVLNYFEDIENCKEVKHGRKLK
jgi:hypothetical protein